MTFSRVNPPGWGTGAIFQSSQLNQLDIDHANALDKSAAGDTLAGVITMASGSEIVVGSGAVIAGNATAGISGAVANAIQSATPGGIGLGGGSTDWPTFYTSGTSTPAPRTRSLWVPGDACCSRSSSVGNSGSLSSTYTVGAAPNTNLTGGFITNTVSTSNGNGYAYYLPLGRGVHNGATLTGAVLYVNPNTSHTVLPSYLPGFALYAIQLGTLTITSLTAGFAPDLSGTIALYKTPHTITATISGTPVIDTSQYAYYALIIDEGDAANALNGNIYPGIKLTYSVSNMQFP